MPFAPIAGPLGAALTAGGVSGGVVLGAGLATAAATGYIGYQRNKANKLADKAANDAAVANQAAIQNVKDAQGSASANAQQAILARRRTASQSVYTSPLGLSEQATTSRKQLLGE